MCLDARMEQLAPPKRIFKRTPAGGEMNLDFFTWLKVKRKYRFKYRDWRKHYIDLISQMYAEYKGW